MAFVKGVILSKFSNVMSVTSEKHVVSKLSDVGVARKHLKNKLFHRSEGNFLKHFLEVTQNFLQKINNDCIWHFSFDITKWL